jgi:hypothetical protein
MSSGIALTAGAARGAFRTRSSSAGADADPGREPLTVAGGPVVHPRLRLEPCLRGPSDRVGKAGVVGDRPHAIERVAGDIEDVAAVRIDHLDDVGEVAVQPPGELLQPGATPRAQALNEGAESLDVAEEDGAGAAPGFGGFDGSGGQPPEQHGGEVAGERCGQAMAPGPFRSACGPSERHVR